MFVKNIASFNQREIMLADVVSDTNDAVLFSIFPPPAAPSTRTDISDLDIPELNVWVEHGDNDTLCAAEMMKKYADYCEDITRSMNDTSYNFISNMKRNNNTGNNNNDMHQPPLCPCVPSTLRKYVHMYFVTNKRAKLVNLG